MTIQSPVQSLKFGLRSHFMDSEPHPFLPRSVFCVGASPLEVCWALSPRGAGKIRQDVTRSEKLSHITVNHRLLLMLNSQLGFPPVSSEAFCRRVICCSGSCCCCLCSGCVLVSWCTSSCGPRLSPGSRAEVARSPPDLRWHQRPHRHHHP